MEVAVKSADTFESMHWVRRLQHEARMYEEPLAHLQVGFGVSG